MREAVVSGQFYPYEREELEEEVLDYLSKKKERIIGAIVPHAGYMFSGEIAGKVLGRIPEKKDFIILGVNHSGLGGKICFSKQDFSTPLGIVKNNIDIGEKIIKKLKKDIPIEINEQAHSMEHSIEVELPFLQKSQKKFSIIPILLKDLSYEECMKIAEVISEFVNENTCLIISSDFTHYGLNYGFVPFKTEIKKNLYALDNEIIVNILNMNSRKVFELSKNSTVCGVYGLTIISEIAKIKKWKAKLVEYYNSGDIMGDWNNAVGYAGISFS